MGPINLAPGVTRRHFLTYLYASFTAIGLLAGINVLQSYVLVEHLAVPPGSQGTVSGTLVFWQEIIALILINPLGMLADRVGRRPIMALGMVFLTLGYALYPFATSVAELTVYRALAAVGAAALGGLMAVVANDYPTEDSRGKLLGAGGVMTGLGVLFMTAGLSQVPALLRARGVDAVTAGQVMFLLAAAIGLVSVVVLARGLRPGTGTAPEQQAGWRQLATAGLRGARNPRILLSYACAFTGRADVALKGTFVAMWALVAAPAAGVTPADALGRGGMMLGIMGAVALVWTPLFGLLLDRVNRVSGVALAMGLAGIGYGGMAFIESPLVNSAIPAFILLSIGQVSAIQASVTLVGQEAPAAERGGVVAMNAWFGALGILVSTALGGWLFDNWAPAGPFVLAGAFQLVLCVVAVVIRILAPGPVVVRS